MNSAVGLVFVIILLIFLYVCIKYFFFLLLKEIYIVYAGVVLFPEATLPLRVIQPNFVLSIDRALNQVDAPYTIGVVGELLVTTFDLFCPWIVTYCFIVLNPEIMFRFMYLEIMEE